MRNETPIAQQIRAKLIGDGAEDLHNDTIDRVLSPTIGGLKLVAMAKDLRDRAELFAPGYQGQHLDNLTLSDKCFLCHCIYYNCLCSHTG